MLHFDKHAIQLLHFVDTLRIHLAHFFALLCFRLLAALNLLDLPWRLLGCIYFVDRVRVYIVSEVRRIEFFQPITHLFLGRKFEEVLKPVPLTEGLVDC